MRRIFSTVRRPHEPAFTVESLAMMATGAPVEHRGAGDDAVGRQLGVEVVRQRSVLDEASGVDEARDALAREELALLGVLLVVLGRAALLDAGEVFLQLLLGRHGREIHYPEGRQPARAIVLDRPGGGLAQAARPTHAALRSQRSRASASLRASSLGVFSRCLS